VTVVDDVENEVDVTVDVTVTVDGGVVVEGEGNAGGVRTLVTPP